MDPQLDLTEAAQEELERACSLGRRDMAACTPWGDTYEGMAPSGRAVEIERRYLWAHEPAGAVIVEVEVRDPAQQTGAEARAVIAPPNS